MTIDDLDKIAEQYAAQMDVLSEAMRSLEDEIVATKRRHLKGIKRAAAGAAAIKRILTNAVSMSPELFQKPKTLTLRGIKIGFQKGKGQITWSDEGTVLKLIHKHLPEQADTLIRTTESPLKAALAQLTPTELRRIGVELTDTGDEVIVRRTDGDVEKMVDALLKGAEKIEEVAA